MDVSGRGDPRSRVLEHHEEQIALGGNLEAVVRRDGSPDEPLVFLVHRHEPIAERLDEPGAALDVGEQEGHGTGREVAHRTMMRAARTARRQIAPLPARTCNPANPASQAASTSASGGESAGELEEREAVRERPACASDPRRRRRPRRRGPGGRRAGPPVAAAGL